MRRVEDGGTANKRRHLIVLAMLITIVFLLGCDFFQGADSAAIEDMADKARQMTEEVEEQAKYRPEADQVLASGDVLSVRVNYGKSAASQCEVRIDNKRNNWYDEVEFTVTGGTPLGDSVKPYDDFRFGSTNFNRQLTKPEHYDPKDAGGQYTITVTANDGYSATTTAFWDDVLNKFSPNLLSFSLD